MDRFTVKAQQDQWVVVENIAPDQFDLVETFDGEDAQVLAEDYARSLNWEYGIALEESLEFDRGYTGE